MYIDNVLRERIAQTAQEIVVHSVIDKRDSAPDYSFLQDVLKELVEGSIDEYLDSVPLRK